MAGWSSSVSSASAGSGARAPGPGSRRRSSAIASSSRASGQYTGQSSLIRCHEISTTTFSCHVARYIPSSVTRPIGVTVSSQLAAIAWTSVTRSAWATTSMRSCDSESRISYGVIPGSRVGTRDRSTSTPTPPRAAISADDEVSPAAPMSWIATMWPEAISSRLASSSSVPVNAAHHTGAQVTVTRLVHGTEAQAVEQRHRPGAHREHVAQDPAHPGGGPLIRLDGGGVVVRFDLEGDRPAIGEPQHAGVLARALDHLRTRGGERSEDRPRVLVGAVLAPQGREHAELGERGRATEQRLDAPVLLVGEMVIADQLGRDRRVTGKRDRPRHGSDAFAPETP